MNTVPIIRGVMVYNYLHFLAITFLYYDHLLTLKEEITRIWLRPKSVSSAAFLFNRYIPFFANIVTSVVGFHSLSEKVCKQFNITRQYLLIIIQIIVGVLLILRTWALYGRDRRIIVSLIAIAAVLLAVAAWATSVVAPNLVVETISGCHVLTSLNSGIHVAAAWEALFIFDSIIFILTLLKTYRSGYLSDDRLYGKLPLIILMLRDGAIYFAVMALANLINILTYYFASEILRGCLSTFASSISVTMMSRLMLNLHESAAAGIFSEMTTSQLGIPEGLIFASDTGASHASDIFLTPFPRPAIHLLRGSAGR